VVRRAAGGKDQDVALQASAEGEALGADGEGPIDPLGRALRAERVGLPVEVDLPAVLPCRRLDRHQQASVAVAPGERALRQTPAAGEKESEREEGCREPEASAGPRDTRGVRHGVGPPWVGRLGGERFVNAWDDVAGTGLTRSRNVSGTLRS